MKCLSSTFAGSFSSVVRRGSSRLAVLLAAFFVMFAASAVAQEATIVGTVTDPSRLAVRMDSVQWKAGSAVVKVYVTAWYYPTRYETGQEVQYGPQKPATKTWNGAGAYPDPNSDSYQPFPKADSNSGAAVPDTPNSITSSHRVRMKDVESAGTNGTLTLVSKRNNIKLDKLTTYVLASSDLLPAK